MKQAIIFVLLITLAGCMTLGDLERLPGAPGYINESVSKFDGSRELNMLPGWTEGVTVRLGLFWRSTMPTDVVYITAMIEGAHNLEALSLNIDGEIMKFEPADQMTQISTTPGYQNWSEREYRISRQIVERMLAARRVAVRVDMMHNYAEGIFSNDLPTMARPAFRAFHAKIWGDSKLSRAQ